MKTLPDGDTAQGEFGPYVVTTGHGAARSLGFLIICLVAVTALGGMAYFFGELPIWGAVMAITGLVYSVVQLLGGGRKQWTFSADGIDYREMRPVGGKTRHIGVQDIVAVGIETDRSGERSDFPAWVPWNAVRREKRADPEAYQLYKLAFKLRSGEVLRIDRQQVRAPFVMVLQELARRMPLVTWPAMR